MPSSRGGVEGQIQRVAGAVASSDDVIEAIFAAAAEAETTADVAASLSQLWRAGGWTPEAIVANLNQAIRDQ